MENAPVPLHASSPLVLADIRLLATDMDGTLTDRGQFTATLLETLTTWQVSDRQTLIVTGRSAGWVQAMVAYLPVVGAIAENGGVFLPKATGTPQLLVDLPDLLNHRGRLADCFAQLRRDFPALRPAADNAFRLTDWTFEIGDLSPMALKTLHTRCQEAGWGFTYSTVQCHIRLPQQDKGVALQQVLQAQFPTLTPHQVMTVGDSPNDEGLFDSVRFPLSVGVSNVRHYCDRLQHCPAYITTRDEVYGFQELVHHLLRQDHPCMG